MNPWLVVGSAGACVEASLLVSVVMLESFVVALMTCCEFEITGRGDPEMICTLEQGRIRTWSLELVIGGTREGDGAACVVVDVPVMLLLPLLSLKICCCHCLEKRF